MERQGINPQKKKKKDTFISNHPILIYIFLFLVSTSILYIFANPNLQPLRDSMNFNLIIRLVISCTIIYFTWFVKSQPKLVEKIFLSLFALAPWQVYFIRSRRLLLFILFIFLISFLSFITIHYFNDKKYSIATSGSILYLLLITLLSSRNYTFLNNSKGLHFWKIALIITALVIIIYVLLRINGKIKIEKQNIFYKFICPAFFLFMSYICINFMLFNINYIFDFSKPVNCTTTISDKRVESQYKRTTNYIFIVNVQNKKKEFYVSQSEYYNKNIGETYEILLYSGALGDAYYTHD